METLPQLDHLHGLLDPLFDLIFPHGQPVRHGALKLELWLPEDKYQVYRKEFVDHLAKSCMTHSREDRFTVGYKGVDFTLINDDFPNHLKRESTQQFIINNFKDGPWNL